MSITAESERLCAYYPFDNDVLEHVAAIAEEQRNTSWSAIKANLPETTWFTPRSGKPIEILDITPKAGYESVHVFHLPMGNGLDENMVLSAATLAAINPAARFIAAGNPGAPGQKSGKLRMRDMVSVWGGDMRPTVDPLLQYLADQRIDQALHTGGSCGADRAATAAGFSDKYDHQVSQAILMEPASVACRSLFNLGKSFYACAAPLDTYVQATQSNAYFEARKLADKTNHGALGFVGLLRPSNIAISRALAQDGFEGRVSTALDTQKDMRVDVIWGSESELCTHGMMLGIADRLTGTYGDRVRATPIEGQKHAMNGDIFLQAAIVLQAQKK